MGLLRRTYLTLSSEIAWRIPGRPARLLQAFSLAERGSMVDVLAACAATQRRDLRRKYFIHALDEGRHANIFAERVSALGARSRAEAAVEDAGLLVEHGIVGGQTLYERLGEMEFLAFVYVAEGDAVEQFKVYLDRKLPDEGTRKELVQILKDEQFHVSYSKQEVERYRKEGRPIDAAVRRVRLRRVWERWLRFTRDLGGFMSGLWLTLLYFVLLAPFRVFASLERGGLQPVAAVPGDSLARARSEG